MLLLVLGDNFILMFFGWEGVGLCTYLLIGFWYKDREKAKAGMKAFVVNRIGDFGFIVGLFLLFWGLGGVWQPRADARSVTYVPEIGYKADGRDPRLRARSARPSRGGPAGHQANAGEPTASTPPRSITSLGPRAHGILDGAAPERSSIETAHRPFRELRDQLAITGAPARGPSSTAARCRASPSASSARLAGTPSAQLGPRHKTSGACRSSS